MRAELQELGFDSREEALRFLKRLWREENAACPVCGGVLGPLHRKAKKDGCDFLCADCGRIYRTIHLLDEINRVMPDVSGKAGEK